jgi:abequosyltransferase
MISDPSTRPAAVPAAAPRPKVSLCIATMNREAVFGETLASIGSQITAAWEVVIVDGSAGDGTRRLVEAERARLPALTYERRPPAGFDRDYDRAVELSRGEYCWLFTDDDVLRPGALAAVLAAVASGPDCVIVNAEVRDPGLRIVLESRRLRLDADRRFAPGQFEAFVATILQSDYLSYVGAMVIRREVWDARDRARHFGTDFMPVGLLLQAPLAGHAIVIAHPWIAIRYGVALWLRRGFEIWMLRWPRMIWETDALGEATKRAATPREPWRDLKRLAVFRAHGWLTWAVYRRWLHGRPMPVRLRLAIWMLCALPFPVANRMVAWVVRHRWKLAGLPCWDLDHAFANWRRRRKGAR